MPKPKGRGRGNNPQSGESTQDIREVGGSPGESSSSPQPKTQGATGLSTTFGETRIRLESRISKVEAGMQTMASMLGGIQASMDRLEANQDSSGARSSRKRQRSPPWMSGRQSRSSSSTSSSRSSSPRRGKDKPRIFDQSNFLDRSIKVDGFEALMLLNIRVVKYLAEQGEDLVGLISHVELLCEKALTKVYRPSALIAYDQSVRGRASDKGPSAFGFVANVDVLRYFSFDSTVVATSSKPKTTVKSGGGEKKPCFTFNKTEGGCKMQGCRYTHCCMYCRSTSHGASSCTGNKPTK